MPVAGGIGDVGDTARNDIGTDIDRDDLITLQVGIEYTTLFSPAAPETDKALRYWMRNLEVLCDVAFKEDFPVQQDIQKNLLSGALSEVVYGRLEPALVHYHSSVNRAVEEWRGARGQAGAS